jgi:hypothetical protein
MILPNSAEFRRIFASFTSKMNRQDFERTGPDGKIRPVPTLAYLSPSIKGYGLLLHLHTSLLLGDLI